MAYVEDYEINENGEEDGAFFVEYITEEDENLINADTNDSEYEVNQQNSEGVEADDELYNCNLCGMNFKSITEHIEKYHSGQDVLIDISEENSASIKTEQKPDDPLEFDESNEEENGSLSTTDNINLNDGEFIVFGDESMENENENDILDNFTDDDDQSEVYTYDDTTGSLTRATSAKVVKRTTTAVAATANVEVSSHVTNWYKILF